jgi:hypothetical protein
MGEVKVTEWVRGGQIAWMESIQKGNESAHEKMVSFIRQYSAAGYISHVIKPVIYTRILCQPTTNRKGEKCSEFE